MKPSFFFIIIFLLSVFILKAQEPCGIYRTASAYRIKQISIPANCQFGKKAIQLSDFFLRPYVYIRTEQGKIKIHADSIYAIQDCEGNIYRIWKQEAFLLSDNGKLKIYSHIFPETVKVRTAHSIRYEKKPKTHYYFSVSDGSPIVPLTLSNVRLALLTDKELDRQLKLEFPDDASLKLQQGKQFKINQFISDKIN